MRQSAKAHWTTDPPSCKLGMIKTSDLVDVTWLSGDYDNRQAALSQSKVKLNVKWIGGWWTPLCAWTQTRRKAELRDRRCDSVRAMPLLSPLAVALIQKFNAACIETTGITSICERNSITCLLYGPKCAPLHQAQASLPLLMPYELGRGRCPLIISIMSLNYWPWSASSWGTPAVQVQSRGL